MAHFPIFIDLNGKRVVVVGGGAVAARKAETLADFGAVVVVIAPEFSLVMTALARRRNIALILRPYAGERDIHGAALAAAATDDCMLNERVFKDAQVAGIPVNVADDPSLCTFIFPAVVRRGELVAGLTSSGQCPALTARLRIWLEAAWPHSLAETLRELAMQRRQLIAQMTDARQRALQMEAMVDTALGKGAGHAIPGASLYVTSTERTASS